MASGKQLSFAYGEVSPSLRYKSDAVSYSQGLGKLRNMYVRRAGGVSNRPGLEYVSEAISQENIPSPGDKRGITGFTFWSAKQQAWVTLEHCKEAARNYRIYMDGNDTDLFASPGGIEVSDPSKTRFTVLRGQVLVTPTMTVKDQIGSDHRDRNIAIIDEQDIGGYTYPPRYNRNFGGAYLATSKMYSVEYGTVMEAPYLPVTYLFTGVKKRRTGNRPGFFVFSRIQPRRCQRNWPFHASRKAGQ